MQMNIYNNSVIWEMKLGVAVGRSLQEKLAFQDACQVKQNEILLNSTEDCLPSPWTSE